MGSNPTLSVSPQVLASGFAPVAQWIRASDYGSEGRGFESLPALFMFTDTYWMTQALELAKRAAQMGEVPVGAVIVRNDRLIATAHNLRQTDGNPIAHAEILAIQSAARQTGDWRLTDTALYVTLEPCSMCAGAILLARIPRLIYATKDPKSGAVDTLFNLLSDQRLNHQAEIRSGVMWQESRELLQSFFQQRRENRVESCRSG